MTNKEFFSYQKKEGKKEPYPIEKRVEALPELKDNSSAILKQNLPIGYVKGDGFLSYSIVCVISGGTVRERDFLNEIEKKHSFRNLEIVFVSTNIRAGGLTPRMMLDISSKICKDGKIYLQNRSVKLDSVDAVYMFTDVDHYGTELEQILTAGGKEPIWIISNPCFEIWIYYCYRNNPDIELADVIAAPSTARSSLLKAINGRFNNGGGLDPRKAFERLADGISHSKEHYKENSKKIPAVLSTQMHLFAENVLSVLDEEYYEWLQRRNEIRNRWKKTRSN